MARKTGLGRGLGAIFGTDVVESVEENVSRETSRKRTIHTEDPSGNKTAGTGKSAQAVKNNRTESKTGNGSEVGNKNAVASQKQVEVSKAEKNNSVEKEETGKEFMMKLSMIEPNEEQPRKDFNEELIGELADSIKKYGVLQPLLVQKKGEHYEIIAGERRWRAAKVAGLKEIPVVIREYSKQQAMEIALIENVQRADLNPIEEAIAYQQLMDEFDLTQEEIAERVSKNRVTVTNSIRLLKLDRRVQEMLIQGQLTSGHARALLGLEDGEQQYQVALKIVGEHLSVREVEKLVKALNKPKKPEKEKEEERDLSFIFHDLEERMKQVMGTKVVINKRDKNKGKVEIEYYSEAELERIVELIESIRQQ